MVIRRCVPEIIQSDIVDKCHASPYERQFAVDKTTEKSIQSGFYWPTLFKGRF